MASGRDAQVVSRTGEYLVAAELGRRGWLATTLAGNAPGFDIVAVDEHGRQLFAQAKTTGGGSWQFSITQFAEIDFRGDVQHVGRKRPSPVPGLLAVLVQLGVERSADRFYVLAWEQLRDELVSDYAQYLMRHDGRRAKNPKSFHTALRPGQVVHFENNWSALSKSIGRQA